MKKKMFICLLLAFIMMIGCSSQTESSYVMQQPTSTEVDETDLLGQEASNTDDIEPTTTISSSNYPHFDSGSVKPFCDEQTQTVFPVTLAKIDDTIYTYYNQMIDFSAVSLAVTAFNPLSQTEALCLQIRIPEEWSEDVKAWMAKEGLRLRFEVDGKPINGFACRSKAFANNTIEVIYHRCVMNEFELSGAYLSIRPYVEHISSISTYVSDIYNGNYQTFDLDKGDNPKLCFSSREKKDQISGIESERFYLDFAAVSISMHLDDCEANAAPPMIETIIFSEIDWPAMIEHGLINMEGEFSALGTVYLRKKDFSRAALVLDELHFWKEEIKLAFTWRFPEDWTEAECQSMIRNRLYFFCYLDGNLPGREINLLKADYPFGSWRYLNFGSVSQTRENVNETNYNIRSFREMNYQNWVSSLSVDEWKTHSSLTIIPFFYRWTNLDIPDEGIAIGEYNEESQEIVWLPNLAVSIELTPDLFDSGL